jgi:hypothetical protein
MTDVSKVCEKTPESNRPRTGAAAGVPLPPLPLSPSRAPGSPFEQLDSDELDELMSPTLDPERCPGPSRGTPGGPFGIFNPDGSRAVPAARRPARLPSCSSATSRKLMIYRFDWS